MKRLQIVQSNIEPDKNVLWLDRYKNLKLYNGDGWENLIKASCENLINKVKHSFNSSGFIMNNNSQILNNTNNEEIQNEEYAKYIGEIDNQGNIIVSNLVWNNEIGGFPTTVLLEIGKVYLIKYIISDNFKYLILVPYDVPQVDWNETDFNSRYYIKNKPTIPTNVSELNNDAGYITNEDLPSQGQIDCNYTIKSTSVIVDAKKKHSYVDPFSVYKYNIYSNINNTKYSLLNLDSLQGNKTNINNITFNWNKVEKGEQYINLLYSSSSIGQILYKIQIEDTDNNKTHEHYCYLLFDTPPYATFICCTTLSWQISFKIATPTSGDTDNIHAFLQIPYNFKGNISITPMFYIKHITSSDNFGIMDKSSDGTLTTYKFPGITDSGTINMNFLKNPKIYDTDVEIESSNITYPNGKYEIDFVDYFGELQLGDTITDDKIKSLIKEGYYV